MKTERKTTSTINAYFISRFEKFKHTQNNTAESVKDITKIQSSLAKNGKLKSPFSFNKEINSKVC